MLTKGESLYKLHLKKSEWRNKSIGSSTLKDPPHYDKSK